MVGFLFILISFVSFQPLDSLLERVHGTLSELDSAVGEVERGLDRLDRGLTTVERDVDNGRLQLYSTGKVSELINCYTALRESKSLSPECGELHQWLYSRF